VFNVRVDKKGPSAAFNWPLYYDWDFGKWQVPFVMEAANSKIVRRTQSLLRYKYGNFSYTETMSVPYLFMALGFLYTLATFGFFLAIAPIRHLLVRYVFPQPGQGYFTGGSDAGFVIKAVATADTEKGEKCVAKFVGKGDPGYAETCKYVVESALALVDQRKEIPAVTEGCAGVVTPAAAFGMVLVERINGTGSEIRVEMKG